MSVVKEWASALRNTPKPERGRYAFKYIDKSGTKCCAVGVLCELAVMHGILPEPVLMDENGFGSERYYRYGGHAGAFVPNDVLEWVGLPAGTFGRVIRMNDYSRPWEEIADYVESLESLQSAGTN